MEISDEELKSLTTAILNRHGLDFTCYEPKSLKRRLIRSLSQFGLGSIHELWVKILKEPDFIHPLVDELSVGLTSMFRDPRLWVRIKDVTTAKLEKQGSLDVWHAGCSTGEEIFTYNIVLEELGIRGRVKSLASDMSENAVGTAQKGVYDTVKIKEYEKQYRKYNPRGRFNKYYESFEKHAEMDQSLLTNVTFTQSNLITDNMKGKYDIIFCRNVMIYFDSIAKVKVLNKFYDNLKEDGMLIIGFFDSLVPVMDKKKFDFFDLNHKIFRKIT